MLAALAGVLLGTGVYWVTAPDLAAGQQQQVSPLAPTEMQDLLSRSVLRADVRACGVHRQGTVTVLDRDGSPSGFTNAHVVRGAATAQVSGGRMGVADGLVSSYLADRDAAAVDLTGLSPSAGSGLVAGPLPSVGDPVVLAGFPRGSWTVSDGNVAAIEARSGWGSVSDVLLVDVPVQQGISGGVVVDVEGRAVGLIVARDPGTGWAVAYPIGDVLDRPEGPRASC